MKLQNLSDEDRLFLSRTADLAKAAEKYKSPQFTKFISPHERTLFEQSGAVSPFVNVMAWGGAEECERSVIGFFPEFVEPIKELFPVRALCLEAPKELGHREILGSVLGLGIERCLIGDILPEEKEAILFCLDSIADFIRMNLTRVGRQKITVRETELSELVLKPKQTKEISGTVASLRMDSILGLALGKSRAKVQELIAAGMVQRNWMTEENPSRSVSEGDVFSARGFGRMKLTQVEGETKKGRIRIRIEQYI